MERIWYVAYGSNLAWARFRCYLAGGRPAGGARLYAGCRDSGDPAELASLQVPGALVFGGLSRVWGGGMAFYNGGAGGQAAVRAYLVTAEQFADVVAQEMRRPVGGEFARDLARMLPEVDTVQVMGPGRYETVTRLGVRDGFPMFTVSGEDVSRLEPTAPTAQYLWWIAAGLREAHGWPDEQIGAYLAAAPGAAGAWTGSEIAAVAAQPDAARAASSTWA